ncbi:hypothetical protein DFH09DRAFT_1069356 [Mycena vulgaris]|nr:hypothetical protein DFH09DRAFT_1069356 [Mycena vulgaris]
MTESPPMRHEIKAVGHWRRASGVCGIKSPYLGATEFNCFRISCSSLISTTWNEASYGDHDRVNYTEQLLIHYRHGKLPRTTISASASREPPSTRACSRGRRSTRECGKAVGAKATVGINISAREMSVRDVVSEAVTGVEVRLDFNTSVTISASAKESRDGHLRWTSQWHSATYLLANRWDSLTPFTHWDGPPTTTRYTLERSWSGRYAKERVAGWAFTARYQWSRSLRRKREFTLVVKGSGEE